MDASSGDRSSPRSRQLQGPRPPRLAVSKDSHKVRKPPVAPQRHPHLQQQVVQHQQQQQHQYQQQARQPVIIYDASPKVIHTKPGDFMALVQRLTGPGSTSQAQFDAAAGPSSDAPPQPASAMDYEPREFLLSPTAALSPAARLAAIERSVRPLPPHAHASAPVPPYYGGAAGDDFFLPASASADLDAFAAALGGAPAGFRPGILSPAALPPAASTGLFSPMPLDPSCLSWLGELSPFLASAGTRAEQAPPFAPSPRSSLLLATPTMPSPATFSVLEFFSSNFPDL
ncbi:protein MKS1-like [Panicum miliaceum]|uniref:Protein MKS1-like n=1 Tax=Panicum miliaceum TaxID=4540 RepID=A0A3L6RMS0_PANMI|nr:protein MKS1-like [Panicum miliaceum]